MEYFDQVQRAYAELVASKDVTIVLAGSSQEQTINEQKAYMTRRAAYYINLRDSNYGLLEKTTGNNIMGLSTDIVVKHSGVYYDVATDVDTPGVPGGRIVQPINSDGSQDDSFPSRWVQPTKELAGLNGITPPTPPPVNSYEEVLEQLHEILTSQNVMERNISTILANQDRIQEVIAGILAMISNNHDAEMKILKSILDKPHPDYKSSGLIRITLHPVE